VIVIGELRDPESAQTALDAAESGHLVLSTMHTLDAAETITRLIEFFRLHDRDRAGVEGEGGRRATERGPAAPSDAPVVSPSYPLLGVVQRRAGDDIGGMARALRHCLRACFALRAESGQSLTELLTTLSILGVILGSLTTVFVAATRAEVDATERFAAQQEARLAVDRIRRETHCAHSVDDPLAVTPSQVTLTFDAALCPSGVASVMWCTSGSGSRFALYRIAPSTGTCSGGTQVADFLTTGSVFAYAEPSTASLARLKVDLSVDTSTIASGGAYRLCDEIALRNSGRSGSGDPPTPCPTG
jgi:type II secretory pathway pseudopilin PulG